MKNREIKFRAWDTKLNKWVKPNIAFWPHESSDNYKSMYLEAESNDEWGSPLPEIIFLQFTGLHDRNGKEIYESDLIKEVDQFGRIYEARWYDNGWSLAIDPYHNRHFKDAEHMEVIGNIYDNPELLHTKE